MYYDYSTSCSSHFISIHNTKTCDCPVCMPQQVSILLWHSGRLVVGHLSKYGHTPSLEWQWRGQQLTDYQMSKRYDSDAISRKRSLSLCTICTPWYAMSWNTNAVGICSFKPFCMRPIHKYTGVQTNHHIALYWVDIHLVLHFWLQVRERQTAVRTLYRRKRCEQNYDCKLQPWNQKIMRMHAKPRNGTNMNMTEEYERLRCWNQIITSSSIIPSLNKKTKIVLKQCQSKATKNYNHEHWNHFE